MKYLMSADWWRAASIRAAKTMFQTGAALVVTQMPSGTVDWMAVGSGISRHQPGRSAGAGERIKDKKKKSPTHQALSRCCPKTTTAIHSYNIPHGVKLCKSFYELEIKFCS